MGFDRLINFLIKNFNNDVIETININSSIRKIIVNHIIFDISFIIYHNIIEIENEINNIIKIILTLPFNYDNVQNKINMILSLNHWKWYDFIFDDINEEKIINNFIKTVSLQLNKIIIIKIYDNINFYIDKIHNIDLLKTINIIFDGIPSYSKILEQRRRRVKNYLESQERKKRTDTYFDIENSFQKYEDLTYDYLKWLKLRFTIDKSFGPNSLLIIELENYLLSNLKLKYNNIDIYINSGNINGEADYKIFKTIYEKKYMGDISIHTIDSDLVHQILVQQNYFNIQDGLKKDINLSVIKYHYKNNYIQYIDANLIINSINKLYSDICNTLFNNYIIYDLCLIFLFFGNDHLPSSFEIGPELNLVYFLKSHYNVFNNKNFIITLVNNKINFSLENFYLYLNEINKTNELNKTKILLGRFFKINHNVSSFLIDKLQLNFENIILLCKKLLFDDGKKNSNLDSDDLRYKLINKYKNVNYPIKFEENYSEIFNKLLLQLDISDSEENFCGLSLYNKPFYLVEDDNYQNLYSNFIENISLDLEKKNPIIYDYYDINNILQKNTIKIKEGDQFIKMYIKKIYHLVTTLFGNMLEYNSNNYTYYKYYEIPTINLILLFLNNNLNNNLIEEFDNEINNETVTVDKYLNSINHHIIITPNIKEIIWKFKSNDLEFIINYIKINNFWLDNNENFKYKDFDIDEFLKQWFDIIIKLNISHKIIFQIN